jgi:hypothetical protein
LHDQPATLNKCPTRKKKNVTFKNDESEEALMGGGRRQKGAAGAVPAVVQQRRQPRQNVHGGQKKQREGRHVVDVSPQFATHEGDQQAQGPSAWRTFFAQTDPRRQKKYPPPFILKT